MGRVAGFARIVGLAAGVALLTSCGASATQRASGSPTVAASPTIAASASSVSQCPPSSPAAFPAPVARLSGAITTVAGGGSNGNGPYALQYNGPAVGAWVPAPYAVAVNTAGVLYIGDGVGLRRVGNDGNISTNMQYVNALTGTTGVSVEPRDLPAAPPGQASAASDLLYATQFTRDLLVQVGSQPGSDLDIGRAIIVSGAQGPVGIVSAKQIGLFYLAASTSNQVLKVTVAPGQSPNNGQWQTSSCVVAQSPEVARPAGLALGGQGNLYIADSGSNRIREVGLDGAVRTVAGAGTAGFSGDGGQAAQAQLNAPTGVAVDAAGTLLIADTGNNRVRRVSSDGIITTVVGSGAKGFSGDGGLPIRAQLSGPTGVAIGPDGSLYIADSGNDRVRKINP